MAKKKEPTIPDNMADTTTRDAEFPGLEKPRSLSDWSRLGKYDIMTP